MCSDRPTGQPDWLVRVCERQTDCSSRLNSAVLPAASVFPWFVGVLLLRPVKKDERTTPTLLLLGSAGVALIQTRPFVTRGGFPSNRKRSVKLS